MKYWCLLDYFSGRLNRKPNTRMFSSAHLGFRNYSFFCCFFVVFFFVEWMCSLEVKFFSELLKTLRCNNSKRNVFQSRYIWEYNVNNNP
jgi:hypothetical protein